MEFTVEFSSVNNKPELNRHGFGCRLKETTDGWVSPAWAWGSQEADLNPKAKNNICIAPIVT